jgi:Spy/CpxP family protein refolding chaperone
MRLFSALGTVLLAGAVSLAVTWGLHSWRTPVAATSDDPFDVLDLTAEQKAKIHEIAMAHHPNLLARQAAVDSERQKLAALLAASGVLDETAVERSLLEVARLESELDREVAKNLIELRPLLSEAQQKTLFQHIELRHPKNARPVSGERP